MRSDPERRVGKWLVHLAAATALGVVIGAVAGGVFGTLYGLLAALLNGTWDGVLWRAAYFAGSAAVGCGLLGAWGQVIDPGPVSLDLPAWGSWRKGREAASRDQERRTFPGETDLVIRVDGEALGVPEAPADARRGRAGRPAGRS